MYILFTDGGSRGNPGNAACAYFLFENEKLIDFGGSFLGQNTNNYAEYHGLILGLKAAHKLGVDNIICKLDSELVVKQINGQYKISSDSIKDLAKKVNDEKKKFKTIELVHVPRAENKFADKMVNIILDNIGII